MNIERILSQMANLKMVPAKKTPKLVNLSTGVTSEQFRKYSHAYAVARAIEILGPSSKPDILKEIVRRRLIRTTMSPASAVTWMINCLLRDGTLKRVSAPHVRAMKAAA